MLKWLKRKITKRIATQYIYIDKASNIAFTYYHGNKGSWTRSLNFIEEFAPQHRNKFVLGSRGGRFGLVFNDKLIPPDVYIVAKNGELEIISRKCIEFIYEKVDLKF